MTTLTPSAKSFTGGPNASKPDSSFTTKTMRLIRHPTFHKNNVTLSYPHKIDWRRLTNVWYVRLKEVRQFTDSLETVHRQTVI